MNWRFWESKKLPTKRKFYFDNEDDIKRCIELCDAYRNAQHSHYNAHSAHYALWEWIADLFPETHGKIGWSVVFEGHIPHIEEA